MGRPGRPKMTWKIWQRMSAMNGSSQCLTPLKGTPGDQVWDRLCMQPASYLKGGTDVDDTPAPACLLKTLRWWWWGGWWWVWWSIYKLILYMGSIAMICSLCDHPPKAQFSIKLHKNDIKESLGFSDRINLASFNLLASSISLKLAYLKLPCILYVTVCTQGMYRCIKPEQGRLKQKPVRYEKNLHSLIPLLYSSLSWLFLNLEYSAKVIFKFCCCLLFGCC